jgi:ssDNA-binding Zn-finger/Zn-ribbon topoisomerase 1
MNDELRRKTCFNCGSRKHKLTLNWNGGTFWACDDRRKCKQRLGPCAECGREVDKHSVEWGPNGAPLGPIEHGFARNAEAQASVDEAYGGPND